MSRVARAVALAAIVALSALAGAASADQVKSQAKVKNAPVTVESVTFTDRDDAPSNPGHQVALNPGGSRQITVSVSLSDGNGGKDVKEVTLTLRSAGDNGTLDTADAKAKSDQGRSARWEGTFGLPHRLPPGTYEVTAVGKDRLGEEATGKGTFEVLATLGFRVKESKVDFSDHALEPGSSTHGAPATLTVENRGNVAMDLRVSASPLQAQGVDAALPASSLRAGLTQDMSDEAPLSEGGLLLGGFDLPPGENSERSFFMDIHVPTGDEQYVPAAVYQGSITVSAEVDA